MRAIRKILSMAIAAAIFFSCVPLTMTANAYPYEGPYIKLMPTWSVYVFRDYNVNYQRVPPPRSFNVYNIGSLDTGPLTMEFTGGDTDAFQLYDGTRDNPVDRVVIDNVTIRGRHRFYVSPTLGLSVGRYNATLEVRGGNGLTDSKQFEFWVLEKDEKTKRISLSERIERSLSQNKKDAVQSMAAGSLSVNQTAETGAERLLSSALFNIDESDDDDPDGTDSTFRVFNAGSTNTGPVEVKLEGTGKDAFSLSLANSTGGASVLQVSDISVGGNLDVLITPKNGLAPGYYSADVVASGDNVATQSFRVTYDLEEQSGGVIINRGSGSSGGGSSSTKRSSAVAVPTIKTFTAADLSAALALMNQRGNPHALFRFSGEIKIPAAILQELGKTPLRVQTTGSPVQVQLTIPEPGLITTDLMASGAVKGRIVENRKAFFEKWYTNKVQVVHLDHSGSYGQAVEIAAKVDLTGMDTTNLVFYSYNRTANNYNRIDTPSYWVDKNGYLHFTTERAGDIIISEGLLEKR